MLDSRLFLNINFKNFLTGSLNVTSLYATNLDHLKNGLINISKYYLYTQIKYPRNFYIKLLISIPASPYLNNNHLIKMLLFVRTLRNNSK